ncbi:hypothetical protein [Kordiimonas sp.]|uniref:hypothetical protein n=1 Tax=Kordiimonas sp. TaxID=1970157 RepID=UPI003B51825D
MSTNKPSNSAQNKIGAKQIAEIGRLQLIKAGLCVEAKHVGFTAAVHPILNMLEYRCEDIAGRERTYITSAGIIEGNRTSPLMLVFRLVDGKPVTECVVQKEVPLWDLKPENWKRGVQAAALEFSLDFAHLVYSVVLSDGCWAEVKAKPIMAGDLEVLKCMFFAYLHASLGGSMLAGSLVVDVTQVGGGHACEMYPPFDKHEVLDAHPLSDVRKVIH